MVFTYVALGNIVGWRNQVLVTLTQDPDRKWQRLPTQNVQFKGKLLEDDLATFAAALLG